MNTPQWQQTTIAFADPRTSDQVAVDHLAPILTAAETSGLVTCWFYVRKGDWRLRYLPAMDTATERDVTGQLQQLAHAGILRGIVDGIYEPEIHAFGGSHAMDVAHQLWHHDSRHLLVRGPDPTARGREISIMLCAAMMRAGGLDWYEQGDVWAQVADHRDPPVPDLVESLQMSVKRLLTADPVGLTRGEAALAGCHDLFAAYSAAGQALRLLHQRGQLRRGLRAVLAHHVMFAWNRRSIPGLHQAALAAAAKTVTFGPDPAGGTLERSSVRRVRA